MVWGETEKPNQTLITLFIIQYLNWFDNFVDKLISTDFSNTIFYYKLPWQLAFERPN